MRRTVFGRPAVICAALALGLLIQAAPAGAAADRGRDYVRLVNPWVEADIARWFFFQSASNPFGMVKLRPDTRSGYRTTENQVQGFSHLHEWQLSGVQVMPTSGASVPKTQGPAGWESHVEHDDSEIAEPGYHKLHLDRYGITTELTVSDRVGLHRYTYDKAGPGEILVNLGGVLGEGVMEDAHVTRVDSDGIRGWVRQHGGSYADHDVKLFFDIRFDKPFDSMRGWSGDRLIDGGAPIDEAAGDSLGVYARYDHLDAGETVQMKVALSFTGTDGAGRNLQAEMPGWDFDAIKAASQARWNEMLGRIDVDGGSRQQQVKFYTDLFHVLCGRSVISDVDGRYIDDTWNADRVRRIPLDADGKPEFAMYNYDALWLTQWNVNSVLGLGYPEVLSSFVRSQLQMYRDGGLLPRGPVAGNDSLIMTGSPVTSFIAGAFNKGIRDFDVETAYEAMLDAHSVGGLFDKGALEYNGWTGAGGVRDYLDRGYVPYRSGAGLNGGAGMTLEYAFQDWTLAQVARRLGKRGVNIAQFADVSVSSQADDTGRSGQRAVDGRPTRTGDVEWVSAGEQDPWIRLTWDEPQTVTRVMLSDRVGDANVNAGTLTFSDGSSVDVTGIPADGTPKAVSFAPRTVSWVRFEAEGGSGDGLGLNEIEVWDDRDVAGYLESRSRNWRNLFDPSTGFIRPRWADGRWFEHFDPLSPADFVEANSWQTTWFTSHDVIGLANLMGGEGAYADKLNYAFERARPANFIGSYGQGYVSYGNQPGLQVAHLFNYVGRPWLTQHWVRQVKERTFGSVSTTDGYGHHDEDQGQMGAISALMAIGLFEVSGGGHQRPIYDISSPIFDEITIELDGDYYPGKRFRIVTHGNGPDREYIRRARLDGERLDNAWFHHDQLADGGTLELWMSKKPNKQWGVKQLPPSESASEGKRPVYATGIEISGPDRVDVPYGSVRFEGVFTPADTSLKRAFWSVTAPDGSPTDKATIDQDGVLTVGDEDGDVLVSARNADSGPTVTATKLVRLRLDVSLLRSNAARWPGVEATASSQFSSGYGAAKVRDGIIGSKDGGDWASAGEREPWVQLNWPEPVHTDRVVIYDRPGDDDANGGELIFSDGTRIDVSSIPPQGAAKTVEFAMRTVDWVRFQVRGGTGLNPGLSELEVHAPPSAPDAPASVSVTRGDGQALVAWEPPAFNGGAPVTGYVVRTYRDGTFVDEAAAEETARELTVPAQSSDEFRVAATNLIGTGEEATEPILAERIEIDGPDQVREPYGSVRFQARVLPEDATRKQVRWSVTEPDGSSTEKAEINADGALTVNHRAGEVLVTATAADGGGATATRQVTIALDPSLLRSNAARWPGVAATASSQYNADYAAARVTDGFGSFAGEWAAAGQQNPWVQLAWSAPVTADAVVLYDRPGVDDANGGTLMFSDGSTVQVSGIPADGSAKTVSFPAREITSVRFQVQGGTGPNVGLREMEVRAVPAPPPPPTRVSATAGDGSATVTWVPPSFDGGAPVTGFVVTPHRDGVALEPVTVDADTTRVAVPDLAAGEPHRFTVAARNVMGTGPESAPTDPVTP